MAIALPSPVGFVLGGGGSLGAIQAGMLPAVREAGIRPDLVTGTSVGSLNGAVVAADPDAAAARLLGIWPRVRREHVFPGSRLQHLRTLRSTRTFMVGNDSLLGLLAAEFPVDTFERLALPFAAMVVDAETAEAVALDHGLLHPALVASCAIPGVFPPVWHNGRTFYDGGLVANVPLRQAMAMGARSLVVFDCIYPGHTHRLPESLGDVLVFVAMTTMRQQVLHELPAIAAEVPIVYLPGPPVGRLDPTDFSRTDELIREAYEATRAFLRDLVVDGPGLYGSVAAPR